MTLHIKLGFLVLPNAIKTCLFLCCAMEGPMNLDPLAKEIVFTYPALQLYRKSAYTQLVLAWISAF